MGFLLLLFFAFFASWLAFKRGSAILLLPLMAVSLFFFADFAFYYSAHEAALSSLFKREEFASTLPLLARAHGHWLQALSLALWDLSAKVLEEGPFRLFSTMEAIILGGVLAKMLEKSGLAHNLVRFTAEVAGENPMVHALMLTFISALLFTVLGGLGAVILVGTMVFPIWLSVGLSPMVAACAFLLALSLGGALNPINWKLYTDVLNIPQATVVHFALIFLIPFAAIAVIFIVLSQKRAGLYRYFSSSSLPSKVEISWAAYLAPFLPIFLLIGSGFLQMLQKVEHPYPINAALLLGIVATFLALKPSQGRVQFFLASCFESISSVAPALFVIMGIGMLIVAVFSLPVRFYLTPLIVHIVPKTPLAFVLTFGLLAPLALYRGPLNIWGLGFGLATVLQGAGLQGPHILGALFSVGMIQGVCDPTNTHNVWIANQLGVDVQEVMKKTLLPMWLLAWIGLMIAAWLFF